MGCLLLGLLLGSGEQEEMDADKSEAAESTDAPLTEDELQFLHRLYSLLNSYWRQNLDALPEGLTFSRPEYCTVVEATLEPDGRLTARLVTASGSAALDKAVLDSFGQLGNVPVEPPPRWAEGGVLPLMEWKVVLAGPGAPQPVGHPLPALEPTSDHCSMQP